MIVNLSEHFTLAEATFSETASRKGIDNSKVTPQLITAASRTAVKMEKVREILGCPIKVTSWIRCLQLNRALGSKDTSQHITGEAVDFVAYRYGPPLEICKQLIEFKSLLRWDQLILEHDWVHISWKGVPSAEQRGQVLSLLATGDYAIGLTDRFGNSLM